MPRTTSASISYSWAPRLARIALVAFFLSVLAKPCASVTFAWDPNTEPDVTGYILHYGLVSSNYTDSINVRSTTVTVPNLIEGRTYYFAVTAYNASGIESEPSQEISYQVPFANRPPVFSPLPDCLTANVGDLLVVTNVALDPDFPPQALSFSVSGPFGTSPWIHAAKGIFTWRPPLQYASSTLFFDVTVTDNGTPPLTQTQVLCVAVNDYVMVQLGVVAVRAGQNTNALLDIFSTAPIANLCITIQYPNAHLANLALREPSPLLCSATLTTVSSNIVRACFDTCPGSALYQGVNIAQLHFTTLPGKSAFAPLRLIEATAVRADSQPVRHITRRDGRSIVIADEPLLDIVRGANGSLWLTLFGKPGATYDILSAASPSSPDWRPVATVPLQGLVHQFRLTNSPGPVGVLSAHEIDSH